MPPKKLSAKTIQCKVNAAAKKGKSGHVDGGHKGPFGGVLPSSPLKSLPTSPTRNPGIHFF